MEVEVLITSGWMALSPRLSGAGAGALASIVVLRGSEKSSQENTMNGNLGGSDELIG